MAEQKEQIVSEEIWDSWSEDTRIQWVKEAIQQKDEASFEGIERRLSTEESPVVLSLLLEAAGILGDASAISLIQPFLKHSDSQIRTAAVKGLGHTGEELVLGLTKAMLYDTSPKVRQVVFAVFLKIDAVEAKRSLEKILESPDPTRQSMGIEYLSFADTTWVDELAAPLFERGLHDSCREEAIAVIKKRATKKAIFPLITLRNSVDGESAHILRDIVNVLCHRLKVRKADRIKLEELALRDVETKNVTFQKVNKDEALQGQKKKTPFVMALGGVLLVVGVAGLFFWNSERQGGHGEAPAMGAHSGTSVSSKMSPEKSPAKTKSRTVTKKSSSVFTSSNRGTDERPYYERSEKWNSSIEPTTAQKRAIRLTNRRKPRSWKK